MDKFIRISHWLPIVTFCPVSNLPDLIYISVTFKNKFVELYEARAKIRKSVSLKELFMEEVADIIAEQFPDAVQVTVRLVFGRHIVILRK